MDERDLRRVALEAREALVGILAGDEDAVARIRKAIDDALAKPEGSAKVALQRALAIDDRVQEWALARLGGLLFTGSPDRLAPAGFEEIRDDRAVEMSEPSWADRLPDPAAPVEPLPRYLQAQTLERVETGKPVAVRVAIALAPGEGVAAQLRALAVPPEGATVRILVSAPALIADGELQADLLVPAERDSDPHLFTFRAGPVGLHEVRVEAYRQGTFLGAVRLQVSVEHAAPSTEGPVRTAEISDVAFEPGEITLMVEPSREGFRFQLLGPTMYEPVTAVMGDVAAEVSRLAAELRDIAAGRSPYRDAKAVRRRLRNLGVALWSAAVPKAVQDQFWEQRDRIKMFTIAGNHEIPWELGYPMAIGQDAGFLAEQVPVVRRAYATSRVSRLPLGSAAYVVPPGSPANALAEVTAIRSCLGSRMTDRGVLSTLEAVEAIVEDSPGLLHFACHNTFSDANGSSIALDGGPWKPSDLSVAVAQLALAPASPLVFLNACRTAGETDFFTRMSGWAGDFVKAGAGAFIGTLWAVRSSSARTFAEAFYRQFVDQGRTLGEAARQARRAIADDDGDPTWLAYTVYGNPAAVAVPAERMDA